MASLVGGSSSEDWEAQEDVSGRFDGQVEPAGVSRVDTSQKPPASETGAHGDMGHATYGTADASLPMQPASVARVNTGAGSGEANERSAGTGGSEDSETNTGAGGKSSAKEGSVNDDPSADADSNQKERDPKTQGNSISKEDGVSGESGKKGFGGAKLVSDKDGKGNKGNDSVSSDEKSSHPDAAGQDDDDDDDSSKDKKEGKGKKIAKKAAKHAAMEGGKNAALGAGVAGAASSVMQSALAGASTFLNFVANVIMSVGHAIVNVGMGIVSTISTIFGMGTAAATAIVSGAATIGLTATVAMGAVGVAAVTVASQEPEVPVACSTRVDSAASAATQAGAEVAVDVEAKREEVIKACWSFFKETYGWDDYKLAGMLGNIKTECGFDVTCIEGIYDEPFQPHGPKHEEVYKDWDAYTHKLMDMYARDGVPVGNYYFETSDGKGMPGIGLVQWTGPAAERLLALASTAGADWFDYKFQIAILHACGPELNGLGGLKAYDEGTYSSPQDAAFAFAKFVEGNTTNGQSQRKQFAVEFYNQMSSWQVDQAAVSSISSLATKLGGTATEKATAAVRDTCDERDCAHLSTGTSSIADAALAMAYATQDESKLNHGTELYQKVRRTIWGDWSKDHDMDCGAGVATCVVWSGADIDYPRIHCGTQRPYVESSPKWEKVVSGFTAEDYSKLQPGDVFITADGQGSDHTLVFVGAENVVNAFKGKTPQPASGADFCHASLNERSLAVGSWSIATYVSYDSRSYNVYRCVKPDNSDKWSSAGAIPASTTMCAEEGSEYASADGLKVVEAAKTVPSPGAGLCAKWVSEVFAKAFPDRPYLNGNANNMYDNYCTLTDRSQLMPGMIIAVSTHPHTTAGQTYGHVGIYIGDGMVMDNIGYIRTISVDEWIEYYNDTVPAKWGWPYGAYPSDRVGGTGSSGGVNNGDGSGGKVLSPAQFKTAGVNYYNGRRETYYSERVLPGGGLNIPGRHANKDGFICDKDGYICVAADDLPKGTVVEISFGKAKVYDCGVGSSNAIDIYVNW